MPPRFSSLPIKSRMYCKRGVLLCVYTINKLDFHLLFSSFIFFFHCSLNDRLGKSSSPLWAVQALATLLMNQLFVFPFTMSIQERLSIDCFHIFQTILSEKSFVRFSTASCLFSSKSSWRLIFTAHTSVQLPQRDEA